ncbi:hypothetical protein V7x_40750 [Crateriforma conspicua]|uniref:Uncharacterized protein n=2 Tax=Crateriforma conspicua TaxID=2527996 RepID=A0A5C6FPB0_9PLAN|nr:hypothetical protein V7x_40750 [Crateriforma conspicua]
MNPERSDQKRTESIQDEERKPDGDSVGSTDQGDSMSEEQRKLREAYLQQQRRMRCPGCGEVDEVF